MVANNASLLMMLSIVARPPILAPTACPYAVPTTATAAADGHGAGGDTHFLWPCMECVFAACVSKVGGWVYVCVVVCWTCVRYCSVCLYAVVLCVYRGRKR